MRSHACIIMLNSQSDSVMFCCFRSREWAVVWKHNVSENRAVIRRWKDKHGRVERNQNFLFFTVHSIHALIQYIQRCGFNKKIHTRLSYCNWHSLFYVLCNQMLIIIIQTYCSCWIRFLHVREASKVSLCYYIRVWTF